MALTNNKAIQQLEGIKGALQDQCDDADGPALQRLTGAIMVIKKEIGAIQQKSLSSQTYSPVVDEFKTATDAGKGFQKNIASMQRYFQDVQTVAKALDGLVGIIEKTV